MERKVLLVIFLCSLSSVAYEIALTRIFSISLWYHFAFMIISIAMLGLSASGTLLSLFPQLKNLAYLGYYALSLGIGISLSYLLSNQIPFDPVRLSWERMQLLYVSLYYVVLSVPFFFSGMIMATAFSSLSEKSGLLYGADLLGAGTGSLSLLLLTAAMPPEQAVFILSSIVLLSSFTMSGKGLRAVISVALAVNLLLLLSQPGFVTLRMSPYKGLESALRYPGAEHVKTYLSPFSRVDTFKSPAVRFAPGLSLRYLEALPEQMGFSLDGGEINAITASEDKKALSFLGYLPSALPYELGGRDEVAVLDPKGGLQVLVADQYGSKRVFKVESNPLLLRVIRDEFGDFSGGIYRENTWTALGRSWLRSEVRKFDIIDISLMGPIPSGAFGIAEDYRFTVEAFREYMDHLKPGGLLSINLFILPPPRIELRLLTTIVACLEERGIGKVEDRIAAIRSWGSICILVKETPFTDAEIGTLKGFSESRRFDLIHYPGIGEEETNRFVRMPSNDYFHAFRNILNPETRKDFIESYLFDVSPVGDDAPFFQHYLRLKNLRETYRIMGEKWHYFLEEGYVLPAVFVQVLLLSLALIALPALARTKGTMKAQGEEKPDPGLTLNSGLGLLPYFAFLGIGFMFVEIVLIQRMILPLENPPYAVAAVLTSILISSGIGSLLSHRIQPLRKPLVVIVISLIIVAYSVLLPAISDAIAPQPMAAKIPLVFLALMPIGLLMGIPFPLGLKLLGERNRSLIPWAWAINGCLSVLAPILAVMVAMALGFKMVLFLGAVSYLMAFVTLRRFLTIPHHS